MFAHLVTIVIQWAFKRNKEKEPNHSIDFCFGSRQVHLHIVTSFNSLIIFRTKRLHSVQPTTITFSTNYCFLTVTKKSKSKLINLRHITHAYASTRRSMFSLFSCVRSLIFPFTSDFQTKIIQTFWYAFKLMFCSATENVWMMLSITSHV